MQKISAISTTILPSVIGIFLLMGANYSVAKDSATANKYQSIRTEVEGKEVGGWGVKDDKSKDCEDLDIKNCNNIFASDAIFNQVKLRYDGFSVYSKSLILVTKNGKQGLIDIFGKIVLPIDYNILPIENNKRKIPQQVTKISKDGKHGLIDRTGVIVVPIEYEDIEKNEDYYRDKVFYFLELKGKYGIANRYGNIILPAQYSRITGTFHKDIFEIVLDDDSMGYVNIKNGFILPATYDKIEVYQNGTALVFKDGLYGYVNKNSQLSIPIKYSALVAESKDSFYAKKDNKWGVIDETGNQKIPFLYDMIEPLAPLELHAVKTKDKWGAIDNKGMVVIPLVYDSIERTYNLFDSKYKKWYEVRQGDKLGLVNGKNEVILPIIYDSIGRFDDGKVEVVVKGETFEVDRTGQRIE